MQNKKMMGMFVAGVVCGSLAVGVAIGNNELPFRKEGKTVTAQIYLGPYGWQQKDNGVTLVSNGYSLMSEAVNEAAQGNRKKFDTVSRYILEDLANSDSGESGVETKRGQAMQSMLTTIQTQKIIEQNALFIKELKLKK